MKPSPQQQEFLDECGALGEIVYDTVEALLTTYEDKGVGGTEPVMMVLWELITSQLLRNGVDGLKLRVLLMELQDDVEEEQK